MAIPDNILANFYFTLTKKLLNKILLDKLRSETCATEKKFEI